MQLLHLQKNLLFQLANWLFLSQVWNMQHTLMWSVIFIIITIIQPNILF